MKTAVLLLFFNRPDLAKEVFEAVRSEQPARLYIAVDGARSDREGEASLVQECQDIALQVDWDCELKTLFRDQNLGCGVAVSQAISWFFENEEEGIILEDDCLPSSSFFSFCEDCLERFRDNPSVVHVGGDLSLSFEGDKPTRPFFSRYTPVWGWATWRRAWANYDFLIEAWEPEGEIAEAIKNHLGSNQSFRFWASIFEQMKQGLVDTWDYQLTFSAFSQRGLSIMPPVNLISNIGFDLRATHTRSLEGPRARFPVSEIQSELEFPREVEANDAMDRLFEKQYFGIQPRIRQMGDSLMSRGRRAWQRLKLSLSVNK